jgi:hypothetical protein
MGMIFDMVKQKFPKMKGTVLPVADCAKLLAPGSAWDCCEMRSVVTHPKYKSMLCWFVHGERYVDVFGEWDVDFRNDNRERAVYVRDDLQSIDHEFNFYLEIPQDKDKTPRGPCYPKDDPGLLTLSAHDIESRLLMGFDKLLDDLRLGREIVSTPHAHVAYSIAIKLLEFVDQLEKNGCANEQIAKEVYCFLVSNGMGAPDAAPDLVPVLVPDLTDVKLGGVWGWLPAENVAGSVKLSYSCSAKVGDWVDKGVNLIASSTLDIKVLAPCSGKFVGVVKGSGSYFTAGEVFAYIRPR